MEILQGLDPNPASQLFNGYAAMRRTELMQLCIEKGWISSKEPTPPKDVLLKIAESQVMWNDHQIKAAGEAKTVPLSEAHMEKPVSNEALIAEIERLKSLVAEQSEPEKKEVLAELENPETLMARFRAITNVPAKRSFLLKNCNINLPHATKGEECNDVYQRYLNGDYVTTGGQ